MNKWNDLFEEPTSKKHDQQVLNSAQKILEKKRGEKELCGWRLLRNQIFFAGPLQTGFAAAGIAGLLYFLFSREKDQQQNNLQALEFNEKFEELTENPEDIGLLAEMDLEMLEILELLEELPEDV